MESKDIAHAMNDTKTAIKNFENARLVAGKSSDAPLFSDQEVESIYKIAYDLYMQKKYFKALPAFSTLLLIQPTNIKFLCAQGLCNKMLKQYWPALFSFREIDALGQGDALNSLHIAECLMALGERDSAIHTLDELLASEPGVCPDPRVLERARQWRDMMGASA